MISQRELHTQNLKTASENTKEQSFHLQNTVSHQSFENQKDTLILVSIAKDPGKNGRCTARAARQGMLVKKQERQGKFGRSGMGVCVKQCTCTIGGAKGATYAPDIGSLIGD